MADDDASDETGDVEPTDAAIMESRQEGTRGTVEGELPDPLDGVIDDDPDEATRTRVRLVNMQVPGELVVHYADRDVTFVVDGETALRAIRIFAYPGHAHLQDVLTGDSTARNIWLAINMRDALAMSWVPGLRERAPHVTIDPLPRAAAA